MNWHNSIIFILFFKRKFAHSLFNVINVFSITKLFTSQDLFAPYVGPLHTMQKGENNMIWKGKSKKKKEDKYNSIYMHFKNPNWDKRKIMFIV